MSESKTGTVVDVDVLSISILGNPYNVIIFNDSEHDQVEVMAQIIKAIHCDPSRAHAIMMEAHTTGRAIVFTGGLEKAELVESILAEIKLGTRIEPA